MKIEIPETLPEDSIRIVAECLEDATTLSRWDNCVLSAKFDYNYTEKPCTASLLIIKEA